MQSRRAFTLIELLIVIAIIAILTTIFLPTFAGIRDLLIKLECKANLKKMHNVMMAYAADYEGLLPCALSESEQGFPGGTPRGRHLMIENLQRLGATPEVWCCRAHPRHEDTESDPFYSWQDGAYRRTGQDSWMKYYSMPGYTMFAYNEDFGRHPRGATVMPSHWATWSRFLDGRFMPRRNDDTGNPPLAADVMMVRNAGYYGFWHYSRRESLSGGEYDEYCLEPGGGGHTLFLAGDVVWYDWGPLKDEGPYYEGNNDLWYYFGRTPLAD